MGIREVLSTPRSPWQRAYVERVIGSIRRECLDHVIVFHEARYVELWIRISTTITDREPISRWARTRPNREGFSRQKWDPWWPFPRSADCTTATNGEPPLLSLI